MATAAVDSLGQISPVPINRLFTAADLAAMPDQLPSGPVDFELHQGRLVPMSPPGRRHPNLQSRVSEALQSQGEKKGYGEAHSDVGVIISKNPDTVLRPDNAFVAKRSMPVRESPESYLETIPDLIVEIRSKNDTLAELNRKAATYMKGGAQLVWIVDPQTKTVTEHRPGVAPRTLCVADTLTCDDIIPGFSLALANLFAE